MNHNPVSSRPAWPLAGICLLITFLLIVGYPGNDDKFITYFVSDALADGRGFINLNAAYLEQSSSLAFTVALAAVAWIFNLHAAEVAYGFALLCHLLAGLVAASVLRDLKLSPWYALLLLIVPAPLVWGVSGMENSFYLLWIMLLIRFIHRYSERPTAGYALAILGAAFVVTLTRPEALLVLPATMLLWLVFTRFSLATAKIGAVVVSAAALAIGFRLAIGLQVFPLPVYVKTDMSQSQKLVDGMAYLFRTFDHLPASTAMIVFGVASVFAGYLVSSIRNWPRAPEEIPDVGLLLLAFILAIGAFTLTAGGDWMPNGRFLTIPFFLGAMLLLCVTRTGMRSALISLLVAGFIFDIVRLSTVYNSGSPFFQRYNVSTGQFVPAHTDFTNPIHSRDIAFLDMMLKALAEDPRDALVIASIQAGMVPYYLLQNSDKNIRFVDLRGLTSDEMHDCTEIPSLWTYEPYDHLSEIESCIGTEVDYFYDLTKDRRDQKTEAFGCEPVLKLERPMVAGRLKSPYYPRMFLSRCTKG